MSDSILHRALPNLVTQSVSSQSNTKEQITVSYRQAVLTVTQLMWSLSGGLLRHIEGRVSARAS